MRNRAQRLKSSSGRFTNGCWRGFTIVELLVSIGILGLLVSLFLPAVQSAREAARTTSCVNNLRQIGLASQNFHSSHSHFPYTSVPTTGRVDENRSRSPFIDLLPYLDQSSIYEQVDHEEVYAGSFYGPPRSDSNSDIFKKRLPIFLCLSDSHSGYGVSSYRACVGIGPFLNGMSSGTRSDGRIGFLSSTSGAFRNTHTHRVRDFLDGLDHTAFFSEKLVGDGKPTRFAPRRDSAVVSLSSYFVDDTERACRSVTETPYEHDSYGGFTWFHGGQGETWYNHLLTPNSRTPDCQFQGAGAFTARSQHPGGVNVLMASGRVDFVASEINLDVWRSIATRNGKEVVEP